MKLYQSILLALVGANQDNSAAALAFDLAGRLKARLNATLVRPEPNDVAMMMIGGYSGPALDKVAAEVESHFKSERDVANRTWQKFKEDHSDIDTEFEVMIGDESDVLAQRGRLADMVVMPHPAGIQRSAYREVVEETLFQSGRPVLLAASTPPPAPFGHLLLVWRNHAQAARAAMMGLPVLRQAERVSVVCIGDNFPHGGGADDVRTFLERHGVTVDKTEEMVQAMGARGEAISEYAAAQDVSMLVMGAVGHSHLRELMLSSMTGYVLGHDSLPVLMVA